MVPAALGHGHVLGRPSSRGDDRREVSATILMIPADRLTRGYSGPRLLVAPRSAGPRVLDSDAAAAEPPSR